MIANLELEETADTLYSHPTSTTPIESPTRVCHSDPKCEEIEQALRSSVRTIFIIGNLGEGKKSLAQIVAAQQASDRNLMVFDEFDQITSDSERIRFAEFVKQISDRRVPMRFVLCGVSELLRELFRAHESSYFYSDNLDFQRTDENACLENIEKLEDSRKATVPHQVHMVSEELFWEMFNDPTFARSLL
jgi:hypothetical protein